MKQSLYLFIAAFTAIIFSSCDTVDYFREYETRTTYDEFDDNIRNTLLWNYIESDNEGFGMQWVLNFGLVQYKHKNSPDVKYDLEVVYGGSDWINVLEDNSLTLLVDGKKYSFSTKKVQTETRVSYGTDLRQERAFYPISKDDLYSMAKAKSVKVKLTGQSFYVQGYFVKKNFSNLRKFLKEFDK